MTTYKMCSVAYCKNKERLQSIGEFVKPNGKLFKTCVTCRRHQSSDYVANVEFRDFKDMSDRERKWFLSLTRGKNE